MKIINDKGRLFGLINTVDLLALLALLAAVGGLVWHFRTLAANEDEAPTTVKMTYTVRARGAYRRMEDMVRTNVDQNNRLFTPDGEEIDAELTGVSFEPYISQTTTADGQIVDATDPERMDIIFTIEAEISKNAAPIMVGTQEIRVGVNHTVRTPLLEYLGSVEKITIQ